MSEAAPVTECCRRLTVDGMLQTSVQSHSEKTGCWKSSRTLDSF